MSAPVIILNVGNGAINGDITPQLEQLLGKLGQAAHSASITRKPIGEAIAEMCESKLKSGLSQRYVTSLRHYLTQFSRGKESRPVHEWGLTEVEAWFHGRKEAPSCRVSNAGRLSALFSFSIRRGYATENPCERLERVRTIHTPPKVLGPRQAMRLVSFTLRRRPQFLAQVVLDLMGGMRPWETVYAVGTEASKKVGWQHIDLDRGEVVVDSSATKTRRRRIVHLPKCCVEWLKLAKVAGSRLPLSEPSYRRSLRDLRGSIGMQGGWIQDGLRHTAASVWLAESQNVDWTARQLGNSVGMVLKHYASLLNQDQARRYRFHPKARHWKLAESMVAVRKARGTLL